MSIKSVKDLHISPEVLARNPELAAELETVTPSKFHNARTDANGMTFQSGHEAAGVAGLILQEKQHQIFGLRLQVRFPLPGGVVYVADATYMELNHFGQLMAHVVDFKGHRTREYINKKKQFAERYGMEIEEL